MDLTLTLGYQEQNDNKAIILTDTSNYNSTFTPNLVGDAVPANADTPTENAIYEIVTQNTVDFTSYGATNNTAGTRFVWTNAPIILGAGDELKPVTAKVTEITAATLDTTITGVDNVPTAKSQVDLYTEFGGPWTDQSELVYTITAALLGDTADSLLIDGLYALEYNVTYAASGQAGGTPNPIVQLLEVTILVYG